MNSSVNSYYEKIPETWTRVALSSIGKITSGGTPKSSETAYYDGNIVWITPADMGKQQSEKVFRDSSKHITEVGLEKSSAQIIKANSIVYSSRAPIGHINIVPFEYTTNQGCKSITPYLINIEWLYFAMKEATPRIQKRASGTTFMEISTSKLGETEISLPPLKEQVRINQQVDLLFQELSELDG